MEAVDPSLQLNRLAPRTVTEHAACCDQLKKKESAWSHLICLQFASPWSTLCQCSSDKRERRTDVTVLPCFVNRRRCVSSASRVAIASGAAGRGVVVKVHSKCADRVRCGGAETDLKKMSAPGVFSGDTLKNRVSRKLGAIQFCCRCKEMQSVI
jgi:hypothetical protein